MPTLEAAGSVPLSGGDYLRRFIELRVILAGLNNGDSAGNPIEGVGRGLAGIAGVAKMFSPLAGSALATIQTLGGRRYLVLNQALAQNVCWAFRPTGGGAPWYADVGGDTVPPANVAGSVLFPATSTPIATVKKPPFGWCTTIQAWCRKIAGGDASDGRVLMGFANNRTTTPSKTISRFGLIGDGLGGYGYGSVNAPDGGAAAVNLPTDHDAGFFQPADLVAPGTNVWHSAIKLVPATPTQPARWGAYHNGVLVKTFADVANFARGHQGTSDQNSLIEASLLNLSSDAGVGAGGLASPGFCELEVYLDDDYTL
jgi:hypothetical protein